MKNQIVLAGVFMGLFCFAVTPCFAVVASKANEVNQVNPAQMSVQQASAPSAQQQAVNNKAAVSSAVKTAAPATANVIIIPLTTSSNYQWVNFDGSLEGVSATDSPSYTTGGKTVYGTINVGVETLTSTGISHITYSLDKGTGKITVVDGLGSQAKTYVYDPSKMTKIAYDQQLTSMANWVSDLYSFAPKGSTTQTNALAILKDINTFYK